METKNYTPHIFALCVLAVLQPIYSTNNLWFVIISAVLSAAILILFSFLINLGVKNKIALFFAVAFSCAAATYGAITAFIDYVKFLKTVQLPQTNMILLCASFAAVIFVFAASENHALYKYCLAAAISIAVIITICFVGGIKNFDFSLFKVGFKKPQFYFACFLRQCAFVTAIPFLIYKKSQPLPSKTILSGVAAGFGGLLVCTTQSLVTLGSVTYDYPYLHAVSVISSGSLFTRLDGLVFFVVFACATIKVALCANALKIIIKNFVFARKVQLSR